MGNTPSVPTDAAAGQDSTVTSRATPPPPSPLASQQLQQQKTNVVVTPTTEKRRIVKAVKPSIDTTSVEKALASIQPLDKEEKDDSSDEEHSTSHVHAAIQPRTKAKKEAKLQHHRLTPKAKLDAAHTAESSSASAPSPNPMSRFLSAFSVQPKHWDHKRRVPVEKDPDEPVEKRLRASESQPGANAAPASTATTAKSVLLYVPNLIGYTRVGLTLTSYSLLLRDGRAHWPWATVLYLSSFVGDLFDGLVARKLNQTSTFGGVLDMITDRCSTLGLLFILSDAYKPMDVALGWPVWRATFLGLVLLDISSHWCQMYASLACSGGHHKSEEGNEGRNFLVRWFYKYYWFFGYLCVGAEFTYILLLLRQYVVSDMLQQFIQMGLWVCVPGCVAKQIVNVAQLASSCHAIAAHDAALKNHKKPKDC